MPVPAASSMIAFTDSVEDRKVNPDLPTFKML